MKEINYEKEVGRCASKSDFREELKCVHYSDGYATSTDSFVLIKAKFPKADGLQGNYKDGTKQEIETWPIIDKMLSEILNKEAKFSLTLNAKLLEKLCRSIREFGRFDGAVVMEFRGEHEPIVLRADKSKEINAIGLVMPMRK